jgi:hypothetical protein
VSYLLIAAFFLFLKIFFWSFSSLSPAPIEKLVQQFLSPDISHLVLQYYLAPSKKDLQLEAKHNKLISSETTTTTVNNEENADDDNDADQDERDADPETRKHFYWKPMSFLWVSSSQPRTKPIKNSSVFFLRPALFASFECCCQPCLLL